jgi:hypothetical protein
VVGITILAVVGIYAGLVGWLVTSVVKNSWGRTTVVLLALAIPFWDIAPGYSNYLTHCSSEGGIRVTTAFGPQKSIYFFTPTGFQPEVLLRLGYDVVEYRNAKNGSIDRFAKTQSGSLEKSEARAPSSAIRIRSSHHEPLSWNLNKQQQTLEDSEGKLIAKATKFTWLGGWLQMRLPLGAAATCHGDSLNEIVLLPQRGSSQGRTK